MSAPSVHAGAVVESRTRRIYVAYAAATVVGVALVWSAYDVAHTTTGQSPFALFWAGYLLVLLSTMVVGTRAATSDRARWLLLLVLGAVSFLPKFFMSSSGPVYFDEFGHWRHVNDMIAAGRVDVASTFQPIIRYYPGLELATWAVHATTRLPTWHAGQIVVFAGHVGALLLMWRVARALRLDTRAAFAAAVVYSLNASYLYFDTEYSYESLGLPLALAAIACAVFARRATSSKRALGWTAGGLPVVASVVVTHHVSSYFLVGALLLVFVLMPASRPASVAAPAQWGPFLLASVALVGTVVWVWVLAPMTVDYLQPHLTAGVDQLRDLMLHRNAQAEGARHQLFSGSTTPVYERICAFLAQGAAAVVTILAVVQSWRDRRDHDRLLLFLPCLLIALLYFASLPLALTAAGGETAHRMWAYAYIGIALMAVWGWPTWRVMLARRAPRCASFIAVGALAVVAVGNVAAGQNVLYRFPGPYTFGTDTRSHTAETMRVADWLDHNAAPGTNVVTDRDTGEIVTGYTRARVPAPADSPVYRLYVEGDDASQPVRDYLHAHGFRYWVVDMRIATMTPKQKLFQGYYGSMSVSSTALEQAGAAGWLRLVYTTTHYRVFAID